MIELPTLTTLRFILRALTIDDVTARYLSWLTSPSANHIEASNTTHTLDDLQAYVSAKLAQHDVAFFGIFDRQSGLHIGNIKYEPVDIDKGYALVGILIGEGAYRGRGVAGEVIAASGAWLAAVGLKQIILGVAPDNVAAVRAYEKAGFRIARTEHLPTLVDRLTMTLTI